MWRVLLVLVVFTGAMIALSWKLQPGMLDRLAKMGATIGVIGVGGAGFVAVSQSLSSTEDEDVRG